MDFHEHMVRVEVEEVTLVFDELQGQRNSIHVKCVSRHTNYEDISQIAKDGSLMDFSFAEALHVKAIKSGLVTREGAARPVGRSGRRKSQAITQFTFVPFKYHQ